MGLVGIFADESQAVWTPARLSGLAGWWDADDASTFTYGTGVEVASWADKSPNHYTVSRTPSAACQRNGTLNGRTALAFTAGPSLQRLNTDVATFYDPANLTNAMMFGVFTTDTGFVMLLYGVQLAASNRASCDNRAPTAYHDYVNSSTARLQCNGGVTAPGGPYLMASYREGANIQVYNNGVLRGSRSDASGTATSGNGTLIIGQSGSPYYGTLCEVIVVARYDATDFTKTQNYLATRWGITLP
jgi:hypothetical protein